MGSGESVSASELRGEVDKEVFKVLSDLEADKKVTLKRGGHKAVMLCATEDCPGHTTVPGTAKNPGNAAKRLKRWAGQCPNH